jgi:hypothetical protein
VEASLGLAVPSSDLSQYASPGLLLELHLGAPPLPGGWGGRSRLQLAGYQPAEVRAADGPNQIIYDRRTTSFTASFELLTPMADPDKVRLRGVFGLDVEAWRVTETETRRYGDGMTPDLQYDNGYGVYFGWGFTAGLRLEFARQAHAELRLEAAKVAFVGVLEDRSFNAPVRLTTTVGWRF